MSNIKFKLAVFSVSIASAAAGSALLTEAPALANPIAHSTPAQAQSQQVSYVRRERLRVIGVRPDLRRSVRPDLRR